jgi:two-component system KDP operon response regulator KdpE
LKAASSKVLVIDDDPGIRSAIASQLRAAGYHAITADDGRTGLDAYATEKPDLVLTDLAMPDVDGFEVIATIRRRAATPIIVLSVRGAEQDRIQALDLGADDFVPKPFSLLELLARVRAQLRRLDMRPASGPLKFPGLEIDSERRRVIQGGREIHLTPTEFALLDLFASNAGKPVTMDHIISRVWKAAPGTTPDTVRVHVASLRRKIEPDAGNPRYLVTEPWVGYRFIAEPLG